jgi:hypothetical protein
MKGKLSPGTGKRGFGGNSVAFSCEKALFTAFSLCQRAFEIDFLSISSIIIKRPSLPAKNIKGMWQLSKMMKAI